MEGQLKDILDLITRSGGVDEAHHKQWVLDQIVRIATGSPKEYQKWEIT